MRIIIFGSSGWIGSELCRSMEWAEPIERADCDITVPFQVESVLSDITDELHVINAAGRNINGTLASYTDESYRSMVDDNLTGAFNIARAFKKERPRPGSSIIFLSSVVPRLGVCGTTVYSAVKAAVAGMVKSMAHELAPDYRVNCIELGYFNGGMISSIPPEMIDDILDSIPVGRLGDSESIVQTCRYLMKCRYATGGVIPLTGGL